MKKQLALTALAIAIAAPGTALATEAVFSGIVQTKLYLDNTGTDDAEDPAVTGGDVRILATLEETVGDVTGYAHYRLNGGISGTAVTSDEVRVGFKGGFGNFMLGKDTEVDAGEYANDIGTAQVTSVAALAYAGSFGPVNVEATYSPEGSDDLFGIGAEGSFGPVTVGATVGTNNRADSDVVADQINGGEDFSDDHLMVGAKAALGPVTLAAHTWEIDSEVDSEDKEGYAVKVSGSVAAWSWGLTYDDQEAGTGTVTETTTTRLDLGTTVAGGVGLDIRFNTVEKTGVADDDDFLYVQLTKSF